MSFLIYFFVLLVSAASVLFGLDLMTAPLPVPPDVPIGRSVQAVAPLPARQKRAADERALAPVYPADPGKPKAEAKLTPLPAPPQIDQTAQPAQANAEPIVAAQPAAQHSPGSCNVQACGAAYYSFRASDCSYQPTVGPRRTCTVAPGATTAWAHAPKPQPAAAHPLQLTRSARQTTDQGEMSEAERIVRRMTRNESGDIPVQDGYGNIIIVRKSYRY
jgi:hypothetical protein